MDLLYFYFFIPLFFDWLLLHLKRIYNAGRRKKKLISRRRAHTHAHTKSPIHTHTLMQSSYMYTNFLFRFSCLCSGYSGSAQKRPRPLASPLLSPCTPYRLCGACFTYFAHTIFLTIFFHFSVVPAPVFLFFRGCSCFPL